MMDLPLGLMSRLVVLIILRGVLCGVEYTVIDDDSHSSHIVGRHVRNRRQASPSPSSPGPSGQGSSSPGPSSAGIATSTSGTVADGMTIQSITRRPDTRDYYGVEYTGGDRWITFNNGDADVVNHVSLQDTHRLAVRVGLKFSFLFYGHSVSSVTIATGGFLYMSDFLHSFLTTTQYIAPLMANFDTSIGNYSDILYKSTESLFVCEWRNVYLKDQASFGAYTFQVQLYKDEGSIVLAYAQVPQPPDSISKRNHPVKVGLSDAFYWDVDYYRTIFPYHTVTVPSSQVKSGSSAILIHKTTCNTFKSCGECLTGETEFRCFWCSKLQQCSDSFDRLRQDWLFHGCPYNRTENFTQTNCSHMFTTQPTLNSKATTLKNAKIAAAVGAGFATFVLLLLVIVLVVVVYGYRNPENLVGQWIIRNRPSELARKFKVWRNPDRENTDNMHPIT